MTAIKRIALLGLFFVFMLRSTAQPPTHTPKFSPAIDNNINGYWEYLPRDYNADLTKFYPLIIFMHGAGEQGDQPTMEHLNRVLRAGTPKLINNGGFPDSFFVMNRWHKFIVLSPQIKNGIYGATSIIDPSTINNMIQFAISNYRVDPSRIYLIGLSMGGGAVWDYAGSSVTAAKRIAAIVVACGAGDLSVQEANNIAEANLPVIATHNNNDNVIGVSRTQANIGQIMAYTPQINPLPRAVYWQTGGHNAWTRTFENILPGTSVNGNLADTLGMNAYQWLLQFVRAVAGPLPVSWKNFTVRAQNGKALLQWEVSTQVNVKEYIAEKSRDGLQWATAGSIAASLVNQYQFIDQSTLAGLTYYRIRQVDRDGRFSLSAVRTFNADRVVNAMVYPNPFTSTVIIEDASLRGAVMVRFIDDAGNIVLSENFDGVSGQIKLTDLGKLAAGNYKIVVTDAKGLNVYAANILKK